MHASVECALPTKPLNASVCKLHNCQAETDLDEIAAYLYARNPRGARNVETALDAAFALLARYPQAGRERRRGIRKLALPDYPYLIFYGIDEAAAEVRIFTIRHAARRGWPSERDAEEQ